MTTETDAATNKEESSFGVVANVLDCNIVVNEFELQSRYFVYFPTNTLGKDMNHLSPPTNG